MGITYGDYYKDVAGKKTQAEQYQTEAQQQQDEAERQRRELGRPIPRRRYTTSEFGTPFLVYKTRMERKRVLREKARQAAELGRAISESKQYQSDVEEYKVKLGEQEAKVKQYEKEGYKLAVGDEGKLAFSKQVTTYKKVKVPGKTVLVSKSAPVISDKTPMRVRWRRPGQKGSQWTRIEKGRIHTLTDQGFEIAEVQVASIDTSKYQHIPVSFEIVPVTTTVTQEVSDVGEVKADWIGKDKDIDLGFGKKPEFETRPTKTVTKTSYLLDIEKKAGQQKGLDYTPTSSGKIIMKQEEAKYESYLHQEKTIEKEVKEIKKRMSGELGFVPQIGEGIKFTVGALTSSEIGRHRSIGALVSGGKKEFFRQYAIEELRMKRAIDQGGVLGVAAESYKPGGFGFIATSAATIGSGVGSLKAAAPVLGTTAEIGMIGYGGSHIYKELKTDWKSSIVKLAVTLPTAAISYSAGTHTGFTSTSSWLKSTGKKSMMKGSTFYQSINPMNKIKNLYVKWGAKRVPPEEYIDPQVLSGSKMFPESSPSKTYRDFLKGYDSEFGGYRVVHGTDVLRFKEGAIKLDTPTRSTDVYGLYVAPSGRASSYFTRLDSSAPYQQTTPTWSLFPKISRPSFREFIVKNISRAPKSVRYNISKFREWQIKNISKPKTTLTPAHEMGIKPETEGVISPELGYSRLPQYSKATFNELIESEESSSFPVFMSGLKNLSKKVKGYGKYTEVGDRNVPIYEYKTDGMGKNLFPNIIKQVKQSYDYSYGGKSYGYVSPSTLSLSGAVSSYKSSYKTSYAPSYAPSYKTSYAPSYAPSYKTSKAPPLPTYSYAPSYKTSYKTSYTTSYTPSYKLSYGTSYAPSYKTSKAPPLPTYSYAPSYKTSKMPILPTYKYDKPPKIKRKKYKKVDDEWWKEKYKFRKFKIDSPFKKVKL